MLVAIYKQLTSCQLGSQHYFKLYTALQGLSKRGMDMTYLGNGSRVLAVGGQCSQGGNIVIWDTQRPLTSGPIARLSYHSAAVTSLQVGRSHAPARWRKPT